MKNFINTFVEMKDDEEDFLKKPYYIEQLELAKETEEYFLDLDCDHIFQHDTALYKQLENYPSDVIPMFDLIVTQCFREHFLGKDKSLTQQNVAMGDESQINQMDGAGSADVLIQIRPFNMRKLFQIRDLDTNSIDKLITIKGIVIRTSEVVPEMKEAAFKCDKCHN